MAERNSAMKSTREGRQEISKACAWSRVME